MGKKRQNGLYFFYRWDQHQHQHRRTHLEVAAFPHPRQRAEAHDGQHGHQRHARGVGQAVHRAEEARPGRQEPVGQGVGLAPVGRVERAQRDAVDGQRLGRVRDQVVSCEKGEKWSDNSLPGSDNSLRGISRPIGGI